MTQPATTPFALQLFLIRPALIALAVLAWITTLPAASPKAKTTDDQPGSTLQGAVIVAHLEQDVKFATSPQLKPFEEQLRKIFGYDIYQLAEQKTVPLRQKGQQTDIATKVFALKLKYLGPGKTPPAGAKTERKPAAAAPLHAFEMQIFQKDELIVESQVTVAEGSPFYIRGPEWGRSEIIFMVLVK